MKKKASWIGVLAAVVVNILLFHILLNHKLDLVDIIVAKQQIEPRTKIEKEMLEMVQIPRVLVNEDCVLTMEEAIGKYTEIEGIIPKGSLLFRTMLFDEDELPDFPALKLREGQHVFSLPIDLIKSSGNSLTNNQFVDLYVTLTPKKEQPITDVLLYGVRIINVVDRKGIDMKKSQLNIPSVINLAIDSEYVSILKKASEMGSIDLYAIAYPNREECEINEESVLLPLLYE